MKHSASRFTLCLFLSVAFLAASGNAPLPAGEPTAFTGWKQATTAHFRFIYADASRPQAEAFARVADAAWNAVSSAYSTPPPMTDVLITGQTDTVNAYAEATSFYMGLFTNPPLSPEFGYRADWHALFFTHELTHIANFSFEGKPRAAAAVFGPIWNYVNLSSLPGWSVEGLTTLLETELTSGGRGRSPFFELLYKAPALENSFIKFGEIGTEKDPPRGQVYVMGYLLMRSIADRCGLGAVADIERNRTGGKSFDDSVKLVTGQTPEELFRDVRIALAKKYAGERTISEGVTITGRANNADWYRPALIADGGIITLRDIKDKDRAAVRYDPVKAEEKILFEGSFADELSLAAAENGTIVAALQSARLDRMPGYSVSTDLYTWTETGKLKQLTRGTSLFQPALSRSGNRLVAVELAGIQYRLVEVDLLSGGRKVLLESETDSFIQPALSADGSQVACLILDGNRAVLATAPMPKYDFAYPIAPASVTKAVNASGPIADIAYPAWTADGRLLFASNGRGRLEVWEYRDGSAKAVVSDPVGAFWAEQTKAGICYASYAGTGYVLKMKPADQWGKVPDFSGPSEPGKIFTLGSLEADFQDFKPYEDATAADKAAAVQAIIPRKAGERTSETQPVLQGETVFHNTPRLMFWLPTIGYLKAPDKSGAFGAGAMAVLSGHPLQNGIQENSMVLGGNWYPSIGQASAFALVSLPVYTGELSLLAMRDLSHNHDITNFIETSYGLLSYGLPLRSSLFYYDTLDLSLIAGLQGIAERRDDSSFAASSDLPYRTGVTASAGVDLSYQKLNDIDRVTAAGIDASLLVSTFPSLSGRAYVSAEVNGRLTAGTKKTRGELALRSRWFDLPSAAPIPGTLVNPKGEKEDCLYPLRSVAEAAVVIAGNMKTRLFVEKMVSFGKNSEGMPTPENGTALNMKIDSWWYTGVEVETAAGRNCVAFGLVNRFERLSAVDLLQNTSIYMTVKLDALRQTLP